MEFRSTAMPATRAIANDRFAIRTSPGRHRDAGTSDRPRTKRPTNSGTSTSTIKFWRIVTGLIVAPATTWPAHSGTAIRLSTWSTMTIDTASARSARPESCDALSPAAPRRADRG